MRNFAAARHLRHLPPLTLPSGLAASADLVKDHLLSAIAAAFVEPFDRGHPLWRIDVAGFLPGTAAPASAALCLVMHHLVGDGIGLAEVLRALRDGQAVDTVQAIGTVQAIDTEHASAPAANGEEGGRLGARDRLRMARQMAVDMLRPCHRSALTGRLGGRRQLTAWEFPRDALRRICRTFDCPLPAALLAMTSGALRRYQQAHGYRTSRDLSVFLPMSTRTRAERRALGNRFVTFRVPLGVPIAAPRQRLEHCRAAMRQVVSLYPLRMSERVAQRTARLPRSWQRRLADSPGRLTNLVLTLVPASLAGASIAGARILGSYGLPALLGVQGAAVAFLFDARMVYGQIVSDPQVVADPQRLRQAFFDTFSEYLCYCPDQ